jgi:hypothetical protein
MNTRAATARVPAGRARRAPPGRRLLAKNLKQRFQIVRPTAVPVPLNKKIYFRPPCLNRQPVRANKTAGLSLPARPRCCGSNRRARLRSDRLATKGAKRLWLRLLRLCLMRPDGSPRVPEVAAISLHWPRFRGIFLTYARCRCGGGGGGYSILPASNGPL